MGMRWINTIPKGICSEMNGIRSRLEDLSFGAVSRHSTSTYIISAWRVMFLVTKSQVDLFEQKINVFYIFQFIYSVEPFCAAVATAPPISVATVVHGVIQGLPVLFTPRLPSWKFFCQLIKPLNTWHRQVGEKRSSSPVGLGNASDYPQSLAGRVERVVTVAVPTLPLRAMH